MQIPASGHWHVVVDRIGFATLANSNVRAIPPQQGASTGATAAA